ncbi:hypothetical protein [Liquorilactobacillus hordei]|uniref:hypothetical protein n=1 Tax=Liquorilactobacillus hordei TaxID=468911 RepID=UPI001CBC9B69|nr:hypothetical protein [Liquorilactobacillus hordei]MBZ2406654.1 hypothetical protein [Liquorilactobacillus hordei]
MDLTKKQYRKLMETIVKKETGKEFLQFKKEIVSKALGKLIEGNNLTRREFENTVLNKALEELLIKSTKQNNSLDEKD